MKRWPAIVKSRREGHREHRLPGHLAHRRRLTRHRRPLHAGSRPLARLPRKRRRGLRMHARHRASHGRGHHGLAALLHTSALAFQTLKYLGVAYLLYMAWNALREQGALRVEKEIGTRSAMQVITTAILINILNPKLSIFFYAFLPQFVSASEPHPLSRMFELSTVFMLLTFAVFIGYG